MPTPHNQAQKGEIAKKVIMPGDPLRAKFIAETFLDNPKLVNEVRGILAYTGTYKGKEVTVMASGMGMPSIGIYSYELFTEYDVDWIIRVGSAGAYTANLAVLDTVLAEYAWSDSTFAKVQNGCEDQILYPSPEINAAIEAAAERTGIPVKKAKVYSSDVFYTAPNMPGFRELAEKTGCDCVEMESFGLFHNANACGKKAACLLTISDSFVTGEELPASERQTAFKNMMIVALEACCG